MMIIRMLQLALLSALLVSCDKEGDVIVDPPPAKDDLLEKTTVQLNFLVVKLEEYAAANGGPPNGRVPPGSLLYVALTGDGVGADGVANTADDTKPDGKVDEDGTDYLGELIRQFLSVDEEGIPNGLLDPFGNPWNYRVGDAETQNPDYDLWSSGPDGESGTEDDITNW